MVKLPCSEGQDVEKYVAAVFPVVAERKAGKLQGCAEISNFFLSSKSYCRHGTITLTSLAHKAGYRI